MDIEEIRGRATRRMGIYYIVLATLSLLLIAGAAVLGVRAGGDSSWVVPLIMAAGLLLTAGLIAVMAWMVRRRAGTFVSPLWGLDHPTRRRIVRAIRTGGRLPPGEQELAVAEATRVRKVSVIAVVPFILVIGLNLFQLTLQIGEGVAGWRIGLTVLTVACFGAVIVYQVLYHRWSGAYLARFGSS